MTIEALHEKIKNGETIKLELGCGPFKKEGYIGIDQLNLPGVDLVLSLENGLPFLPDNSIDEITSTHFLEHIDQFEFFMKEIHRVLKKGGVKKITVPHFSNPYFYSDPTHKRYFGLYTFDYYCPTNLQHMKRKVPAFYFSEQFEVKSRRLVFKSPFKIRNMFSQVLRRLFNATPYMQELFEECFCYRFPCQEIVYEITPIKSNS